jgi:hypothetical protein
MRDLSARDRDALRALPGPTARMVVQRWLELTDPHTHPHWRLAHPQGGPGGVVARVLEQIAEERSDAAYASTADLFGEMLATGSSAAWQQATVRSFLLDPAGRYDLDFEERLRRLDPSREPDADERMAPGVRPEINWRLEPPVAGSTRIGWPANFEIALGAGAGEGDSPIRVLSRWVDDKRYLLLSARAPADTPRAAHRTAARLREEGSFLLDALRLSVASGRATAALSYSVEGSARLNGVPSPPMPRMLPQRVREAVSANVQLYEADRPPPSVRRCVSAMRWLSTALARWHESPAFATALLWMALEVQYDRCVWGHRKRCRRRGMPGHRSAVELYVETLPDRLGAEIESYLLSTRGKRAEVERGHRNPPPWMLTTYFSRGSQALRPWLHKLMRAMEPGRLEDPLLRYHCAEVARIGAARDDVARGCQRALEDLYSARNAIVHHGNVLLEEERSMYLASLAVELVLLGLEHRTLALLDAAELGDARSTPASG